MWFGSSADWGLPFSWEPSESSASSSSGYSSDSDSTGEDITRGASSAVLGTPSPQSSSPLSSSPLASGDVPKVLMWHRKHQEQQGREAQFLSALELFQCRSPEPLPRSAVVEPQAEKQKQKLRGCGFWSVVQGSENKAESTCEARHHREGAAAVGVPKLRQDSLARGMGLSRSRSWDGQAGRSGSSWLGVQSSDLRDSRQGSAWVCAPSASRKDAQEQERGGSRLGWGERAGRLPPSATAKEPRAGALAYRRSCAVLRGSSAGLEERSSVSLADEVDKRRRGLGNEAHSMGDGRAIPAWQRVHGGEAESQGEADQASGANTSTSLGWKHKAYSFLVRAFSSVWMVTGFGCLVAAGHMPVFGLVLTLQVLMSHELFCIARKSFKHHHRAAFSRLLNWHFVLTTMVFMYGQLLRENILATALELRANSAGAWAGTLLLASMRYHALISLILYLAGLMTFVLSLTPGLYKAQFGQLAWTHLVVVLIVAQSSFFAANIFQGMAWFLLPTCLVIFNDSAAYVFGVLLGRTPLIHVSPKKTWEGFLGAAVSTTLMAPLLAGYLGRFEALTCPRKDLSFHPVHCTPDHMFQVESHLIPAFLHPHAPEWATVWRFSEFQLHAVALALMTSIVAPFGGFFASGLKRAYKLKDFGHSIQGHGGVTDRMDCQMIMALISYVYLVTFVAPRTLTHDLTLSQLVILSPQELQTVQKRIVALVDEQLSNRLS